MFNTETVCHWTKRRFFGVLKQTLVYQIKFFITEWAAFPGPWEKPPDFSAFFEKRRDGKAFAFFTLFHWQNTLVIGSDGKRSEVFQEGYTLKKRTEPERKET